MKAIKIIAIICEIILIIVGILKAQKAVEVIDASKLEKRGELVYKINQNEPYT